MREPPVRPLEKQNLQRGQTAQSPKPHWSRSHHTDLPPGTNWDQSVKLVINTVWQSALEVKDFIPPFSHEKTTSCETYRLYNSAFRSFIIFISILTILNWLFLESFDLPKVSRSRQPQAARTLRFWEPLGSWFSLSPVISTDPFKSTSCVRRPRAAELSGHDRRNYLFQTDAKQES